MHYAQNGHAKPKKGVTRQELEDVSERSSRLLRPPFPVSEITLLGSRGAIECQLGVSRPRHKLGLLELAKFLKISFTGPFGDRLKDLVLLNAPQVTFPGGLPPVGLFKAEIQGHRMIATTTDKETSPLLYRLTALRRLRDRGR